MKKGLKAGAAVLAAAVIFTSCQQVFTSSVYFWVETDMSTMSDEQKVSYAEDLLSSGTADQLGEAYAEIAALLGDDPGAKPELALLAADLAVGASGLGEAMSSALETVSSGGDVSADLLEDINTVDLQNAVDMVTAAEDGGATLTAEQYTNAAAAQMLVVIDEAGGVESLDSIDPEDPDLVQAQEWAEAGGIDIESLLSGEAAI